VAFVIAFSGKGGCGKTTLAALMIRHLTEHHQQSVLAVDADPNSCLGLALGVEVEHTVADIREDAREDRLGLSPGMSKERQIEYLIQTCVVEGRKFDLLTMGRSEGPKCYCYINNILRKYLDEVSGDYPFVVIDNEAGMEHLSRRTTNNVNELFLVANGTLQGARTVARIIKISEELPILIKRKSVILNRHVNGDGASAFESEAADNGFDIALRVPDDIEMCATMGKGESVFQLPESSPSLQGVGLFLDSIISN